MPSHLKDSKKPSATILFKSQIAKRYSRKTQKLTCLSGEECKDVAEDRWRERSRGMGIAKFSEHGPTASIELVVRACQCVSGGWERVVVPCVFGAGVGIPLKDGNSADEELSLRWRLRDNGLDDDRVNGVFLEERCCSGRGFVKVVEGGPGGV